jgi:hypothetical protein
MAFPKQRSCASTVKRKRKKMEKGSCDREKKKQEGRIFPLRFFIQKSWSTKIQPLKLKSDFIMWSMKPDLRFYRLVWGIFANSWYLRFWIKSKDIWVWFYVYIGFVVRSLPNTLQVLDLHLVEFLVSFFKP